MHRHRSLSPCSPPLLPPPFLRCSHLALTVTSHLPHLLTFTPPTPFHSSLHHPPHLAPTNLLGTPSFLWLCLWARRYAGQNTWHPPTWLRNEHNLFIKYIHSFFWGAGMVTSTVPYDVEPVTALEALVTTITLWGTMLVKAFVISSLTTALAEMASREIGGKKLDVIRSYLIFKDVRSDLRFRILEYFEYLFNSSQSLARSVRAPPLTPRQLPSTPPPPPPPPPTPHLNTSPASYPPLSSPSPSRLATRLSTSLAPC